ncbi:MAG TPA: hypothetical protein PL063_07115 [Candidatus Cloacimonadota bacterium]|jgi:cell division protein FtsX|nr:hypothetical protein [Candidatus Cloacimonadales bacterium]HPY96967.1 hypothetical protein [Candidatus Cloacimonadota bacterium]HQB41511.1 hypothetical protein [Candidatus Cloacimonadota bacterium]
MKAKNHLIVLIPLYLLVFLAVFLLLGKSYLYENTYYHKLQGMPILVYSQDLPKLNELKSKLEALPWVAEAEIKENKDLKANLIEKYKLVNDDIMRSTRLPNLMIISFKGKEKGAYLQILQQIRTDYPKFLLDYDIQGVDKLFYNLNAYRKIRNTLVWVLISFAFMILFYANIYYESCNNEFWRIYLKAGGDISKRRKLFFKKFFFTYVFGVILSFAIAFYLQNDRQFDINKLDNSYTNVHYFMAFVLPFVLMIISALYLRNKK